MSRPGLQSPLPSPVESQPPQDATQVVDALGRGDPDAADQLMPMVYDELRRLAARRTSAPGGRDSLEPTEIVHEVYVRLTDPQQIDWAGRTHFFAVSARAMRRVLVDDARRKRAGKRGGNSQAITLNEAVAPAADRSLDVLELDDALTRLAELNERQAEVVELRFFGGLSVDECATILDVSRRTVLGDWSMARAWLRRELSREAS